MDEPKKGDKVVITSIGKRDGYYEKRTDFIGKEGTLESAVTKGNHQGDKFFVLFDGFTRKSYFIDANIEKQDSILRGFEKKITDNRINSSIALAQSIVSTVGHVENTDWETWKRINETEDLECCYLKALRTARKNGDKEIWYDLNKKTFNGLARSDKNKIAFRRKVK